MITRLRGLPGGGYAALFAVSHVSADGWSAGVLRRDLSRLYLALPGQQPPELAPGYYQRYVRQQRGAGDALTPAQAGFFRSSLRGVPVLAPRRPLRTGPAGSYRYLERKLPGQDALALFGLARRLRTTPAKILMAASFLALKVYFGQDRFGVLDVSACRTREQADWVGLLSKAVPVPVLAPDEATAGQFIADVHRRSIRTLQQLAGPYSLKRVLALAHQSGDSALGSALYRRMWTAEAPSSHSVMFNCLSLAPQPAAPFGPDAGFRPLFPAVPLAPEKARISDLDVLPVLDGTSVTIAVAAHPAVHDQAETAFFLTALERILGGWARAFDGHQPIGSYRHLAG